MSDIPFYSPVSLNNVIALTDQLLEIAAVADASDLHLEPLSQSMRIRMRVDGLMQLLKSPFDQLPASAADAIVVRIKLLSEMDISESRRPQDGSFQWQLNDKWVDIRCSSLAGHWGENWCYGCNGNNKILISANKVSHLSSSKLLIVS